MMDYWRERFPARMFLPLAVAIALPGQRQAPGLSSLAADSGLALLLLAQFRLWDDIADRRRDAIRHPRRVLVRSRTVRPFAIACGALAVCAATVISTRNNWPAALLLFSTVSACFAAYYWHSGRSRRLSPAPDARSHLRTRAQRTIAGELVRLSKYPAFVFIVSPASDVWGALGACVAFVASIVYEGAHDRTSPLRAALPGITPGHPGGRSFPSPPHDPGD